MESINKKGKIKMKFNVSFTYDSKNALYKANISCEMSLEEVEETLNPDTFVLTEKPNVFNTAEFKCWKASTYCLDKDIETLVKTVDYILNKTVKELRETRDNNILSLSKVPKDFTREYIL